jgi:hypothetical protein
LKLLDSARYLGGLRAVELACFERVGERAPRLAAPACARWAASASLAHAWRASLLEELLPVSVGLPGLADVTVLPEGPLGAELARALPSRESASSIGGSRDSETDDGWLLISDLSGRLYSLLLADYARRLELSSPAADGAIARTLGRAMADLEVVRTEGATLCAALRPA